MPERSATAGRAHDPIAALLRYGHWPSFGGRGPAARRGPGAVRFDGAAPHGYSRSMGLLTYIILLALSGLVVGALARLALPGPDPMGIGMTILIGIAGSFIGGLVTALLFRRNGAGIVVSVLCATAIVYLIRRSRGGSLTDPGVGGRRRRW